MIFKRKKIKCTVNHAPNPKTMEFIFRGDHWSYFFPDIKEILAKGLKPCQWEEKSEGMTLYEIGTDDFHHTLLCEDGELHIDDNNYGLSFFVEGKYENLFRRVQKVLELSGRFELVFEEVYKHNPELNQEDTPA